MGKSSLICHLAEEEVSEVLHGGAGSIRAKECSFKCNGLAWKAVDIPGCNGLHMGKRWTGREVWMLTVALCWPLDIGMLCQRMPSQPCRSTSASVLPYHQPRHQDSYRRGLQQALCHLTEADVSCWPLQKRGPLTVAEFIQQYRLDDAADTDVLLYVTSLSAAAIRGEEDQRLERELVHKCEAHPVLWQLCMPAPSPGLQLRWLGNQPLLCMGHHSSHACEHPVRQCAAVHRFAPTMHALVSLFRCQPGQWLCAGSAATAFP